MHEVVPEWDANFVDIEQELLFELILVCLIDSPVFFTSSLCVQAANYMDIKSLLDLTCAKVASMIKGKLRHSIVSADIFFCDFLGFRQDP